MALGGVGLGLGAKDYHVVMIFNEKAVPNQDEFRYIEALGGKNHGENGENGKNSTADLLK